MSLRNAFRLFLFALKHPKEARKWLEPKEEKGSRPLSSSHLILLSRLQASGRFLDFIKEDLSGYSDSQIGVVVRKMHAEWKKEIEELVTIRPILEECEGVAIAVPEGYDAQQIKVTGNPKKGSSYKGLVVHPGWKAQKHSLPTSISEEPSAYLCPAEIDVKDT